MGRRYESEIFEGDWPDAFCSRLCAWGYIGPGCTAAAPTEVLPLDLQRGAYDGRPQVLC